MNTDYGKKKTYKITAITVKQTQSHPAKPQNITMKLQSEGIAALLSMYADDDEDDIDAVSQGTVRFFIPSAQATPQSSDQHGESQPEAMDYTATELVDVPENVEVVLDNFLPPPPKYKCSHELQVSGSYHRYFLSFVLILLVYCLHVINLTHFMICLPGKDCEIPYTKENNWKKL